MSTMLTPHTVSREFVVIGMLPGVGCFTIKHLRMLVPDISFIWVFGSPITDLDTELLRLVSAFAYSKDNITLTTVTPSAPVV